MFQSDLFQIRTSIGQNSKHRPLSITLDSSSSLSLYSPDVVIGDVFTILDIQSFQESSTSKTEIVQDRALNGDKISIEVQIFDDPTSTSRWKFFKLMFCQLDPSKAKVFQYYSEEEGELFWRRRSRWTTLETWAQRQRDL